MTRSKRNTIAAFALVAVGVTIGLWVVASALASFVALDWQGITETRTGRILYGVVWAWLMMRLIDVAVDDDE